MSPLLQFLYKGIDTKLNYGREAVVEFARMAGQPGHILDIAAGGGSDLRNVRAAHPHARLSAFDFLAESVNQLRLDGVDASQVDLEREPFPIAPGSVNLLIANQVLEHTKELFWIFHQISVALADGGYVVVGVPNLASLHNRVLLMLGRQPTPIRSASAHVRGFTKGDLIDFLESCFPGGYRLRGYRGGNFYPFPPIIAKPLARFLPSLAWGNFFLLQKMQPYEGEFLAFPRQQQMETNFYVGD